MKSIQPRSQRKEYFNAPLHKKRKWMASHLDETLLLKYDRRGVSVVKGDTVKVMRGSYKGHEDKVAHINLTKRSIEVEGLIMTKADGKKIAKPIHPSNVMITKLNLTDKWRRKKLERGLSVEAKKEVEKEASDQIKEMKEEERRRIAEEEAALRAAEAEAELEEEEMVEPEETDGKPVKPKETEKKETPDKTDDKPEKKTPSKPKKEEEKKVEKPKTEAKPKPKTDEQKKKTTPKEKTPAKTEGKKEEDKK